MHTWIRITFLVILSAAPITQARQVRIDFDTLYVESQTLMGSLHIHNLLDKQSIKALRKGMTAIIEYRAQIWHEKNRWVKSMIHERYRRLKINYNHWERKYQVFFQDGQSRLYEEQELIDYCQQLSAFKIIDIHSLTEGYRYRVVAQVLFRPMSMENIQELKQWLSGEADEFDPGDIKISKSPWKKAGDWILNVFVNLTGFGDQVITGKSPLFYLTNGQLLLEEKL
ncbi:DUF4390 domain-containing protein [bacterium]|nr:DUF4390 domain-containing protein [bacterium]